ncbi:MAG: terpene cyclase/mutase family protein [Myxococcales bacterium]|nr:terpene cyclase/mutase family protein [Myxococcales bacterium]
MTVRLSRRQCLHLAATSGSLLMLRCQDVRGTQARRARRFLGNALSQNRLNLGCFIGNTQRLAPPHDTGWVFSLHFVSRALGASMPLAARRNYIEKLRASRQSGTWSYGRGSPVDADDTALAARTLIALGDKSPEYDLSLFRCPHDRLYRTFAWGGSQAVAVEPSTANNAGVHAEVNLNIAELFASQGRQPPSLEPVLEACVTDEGRVRSYFYPSDYYGAYWLFAARAQGAPIPPGIVNKVVRFVTDSQDANGAWSDQDPYQTALAAAALRIVGRSEEQQGLARRFLEESQHNDGSWSTGSDLWRYTHRGGVVWNARDSHRVVTTALALEAIG